MNTQNCPDPENVWIVERAEVEIDDIVDGAVLLALYDDNPPRYFCGAIPNDVAMELGALLIKTAREAARKLAEDDQHFAAEDDD